jgi:hypothetical protein
VGGIIAVSVSLGMISALELGSYAISHHKDPRDGGNVLRSADLNFIGRGHRWISHRRLPS